MLKDSHGNKPQSLATLVCGLLCWISQLEVMATGHIGRLYRVYTAISYKLGLDILDFIHVSDTLVHTSLFLHKDVERYHAVTGMYRCSFAYANTQVHIHTWAAQVILAQQPFLNAKDLCALLLAGYCR